MCIQFDKSSSYGLHSGMQGPVFIILRIEVSLVILALFIGDDSNIFSNKENSIKDSHVTPSKTFQVKFSHEELKSFREGELV